MRLMKIASSLARLAKREFAKNIKPGDTVQVGGRKYKVKLVDRSAVDTAIEVSDGQVFYLPHTKFVEVE